jgi:SnoaL-like protein
VKSRHIGIAAVSDEGRGMGLIKRLVASALALGATALALHLVDISARAQTSAEDAAVLAVADSALAAITQGNMTALTDVMLPEAIMISTGTRDGVPRYRVRTRAEQRAANPSTQVAERGFRPEVRVNGTVAMVWYPYDLYLDGKWSHCGVDVFTLTRTADGWRIATMAWSAEQPPACEKHPDGPPKR